VIVSPPASAHFSQGQLICEGIGGSARRRRGP